MHVRVWEYDVREGASADFEQAYGADGAWARLFSRSDGFEGTELFASVRTSGRYLTADRFRDEASWRRFQVHHREAYLALDAACEGLTVGERELAGPDIDRVGDPAVGAEGPGLSPPLRERADLRLTISIESPVESLNATVAAALVLFEVRRRRASMI